ncbi:MAG: ABC transporter permease [Gemmatimonadaceae bacterium]|nr:ABC transporter permease [Gemmatimonadaceae bacterium]
MGRLRGVLARLIGLGSGRRAEAELREELEAHLEFEVEENIRRGMAPDEARRAALAASGGLTQAAESVRRQRGIPLIEHAVSDLRYAVRSLLRSPAYTTASVLTLALGIGASAAVFSVVNRVLLHPAPFRDVEQLAVVWQTDRDAGNAHEPASIPDFVDFRLRSRSFQRLEAFTPSEPSLQVGAGDPERVAALGVTDGWFSTLDAPLRLGRGFTDEEGRVDGPRRVVISEALWLSHFDQRADVLGRTLRLNDIEWEIIGVAAQGADFGALQLLRTANYQRGFADRGGRPRVDVWVPLRLSPQASRENHPIFVLGRLQVGATLAAAKLEMEQIGADLEREYPHSNNARGANVEAFGDVVFAEARQPLWLLVVAVCLVLLVACVNVTNLALARATNRAREVTVRTALGATAGRLTAQFIAEGAVLVGAGLGLGVLLASGTVSFLRGVAPASLPRVGELRLDLSVLAISAGIAAVIGICIGLLPALHARRANLASALQAGGRASSGSRRQRSARSALVITELAMATALTVGAALLIRSLWELQSVDPGFEASQVLKAEFQLPPSRYPQNFAVFPNWPERLRFIEDVRSRVGALPGVEAVALATANPMDAGFTSSIVVVGREAEAERWPEPSIRTVSAGYFEALRVPLVEGRSFTDGDDGSSAPVVILNESARRTFFDGRDALNASLRLWGFERRVVGIIEGERIHGLAREAPPAVYLPLGQAPTPSAILVRTTGEPSTQIAALRQAVRDVDPQLALFGIEPLEDTISGSLAQRRFTMLLLATFAGLALALAVVGVHGVLSYSVAQRSREIGIRVALGADLQNVRRLVVLEGMRLAVFGILAGLAGALALSRGMQSLLFGVQAFDAGTFALVSTALAAVALLACWSPASRAARVDPMEVLRGE